MSSPRVKLGDLVVFALNEVKRGKFNYALAGVGNFAPAMIPYTRTTYVRKVLNYDEQTNTVSVRFRKKVMVLSQDRYRVVPQL